MLWIFPLFILLIAVHARPYVGVLALAVAIPLRTMLPVVGPVNFTWIIGFVAVLGLAYHLISTREYHVSPLDIPFAILLLAHSLSLFSSPLTEPLVWNYLSIVAAFGVYFLVTNLVNDQSEYETVVSAILVVGALLASITFYFIFTGKLPFFFPVERLYRISNAGPGGRFWGTMSSPSSFALFFLFLMPLALGRAITTRETRRRYAYFGLVGVFAISMTTTLDRSALLGSVIMFSVFTAGTISFGIIRTRSVATGLVASFPPVVLVLYLTGFVHGLINRITITQSFWGGRPDRFLHAIELGITHPLGVGQGPALTDALARAGAENPKKVHNVVLGLFAQLGYIGLIGILWVIINQLRANLSNLSSERLSRRQRITLLSTLSGIAGYWPYSMFHFKYDWGFIFLYFGLNMAYIRLLSE